MWPKWNKIKRWSELAEHLLTLKDLIELLLALGLGRVVRNLLVTRIAPMWLMPIWLLSTALILWFIGWIAPKFKRSGIKPEVWCEAAAQKDMSKMRQRIVDIKWEVNRCLGASDPYIDFNVTFLNASVFNLSSPTIEGKAKFGNDPVLGIPELTKPFPVPRGEKVWMQIRQHLSSNMANKIQELINARRDGQVAASLDFSEIKINFNAEFLGHQQKGFAWVGPERVPVVNPD